VRRAANIDFPEVGAARYYAVFEFKSDYDARNEMRLALGEQTTDVLWPIPGGFCRWSFELPGYSDPDADRLHEYLQAYGLPAKRTKDRMALATQGPALEESALPQLIAERAPWFTASVGDITWRTIVRFERRLATAFGRGRMWIAGDAAHLTGPVGMQSFNSGIAEARDLTDAIAAGDAGKLRRYNDTWTNVWRQLHGLDGGLQASADADPWVRSRADRLLACLPALGGDLTPLARQLGLHPATAVVR
jgi:2-polyprenyl-6-methoxyphenol hydroxylase-like FAD-dependent oxidoreductase